MKQTNAEPSSKMLPHFWRFAKGSLKNKENDALPFGHPILQQSHVETNHKSHGAVGFRAQNWQTHSARREEDH